MLSDLDFKAPTTLEEALAELAHDGAMLLAGGTSLAMMLKSRLIEPERLVYLGRAPELSGISQASEGEIRIGATATLREIYRSDVVERHLGALVDAAARVGNPRVRAVATMGGALVHGDPRQDIPPVLMALDAMVHVAGANSDRWLSPSDLLLGFMEVAIDETEIVTEVLVPANLGSKSAYSRFTPGSEDDYPTVGVAAALRVNDDGVVEHARLALGGVDATSILIDEVRELLEGQRPEASLIAEAANEAAARCNPSDDQRGSSSYKRAMVEVWSRRTLSKCLAGDNL